MIDKALEQFEKFKENHEIFREQDLTEADTRSKLIDFLLINVLGWNEEDLDREKHVSSGYYDYRISAPGINIILEAKKQYKKFILPSGHKRASINSLLKGNEEVITQIRGYSVDEGIPYGIITNGEQFIILKAFNFDGKPWKSNSCLIFDGLADIEKRFVEFYDNCSKFGLIANGGFKFDLPINELKGKTLLSTLIENDKELVRNYSSAIFVSLSNQVFGELFSDEREVNLSFIKRCFVENAETKKNRDEIERLFSDEAPKWKNVIPASRTSSIVSQISAELNSSEISSAIKHPPNPIIIIGSKGAGKTTFINHLFKQKLTKKDLASNLVVYMDFRNFFETSNQFTPEKIVSEIIDKIHSENESLRLHSKEKLLRIYKTEISRKDENVWHWDKHNDEKSYQQKVSQFLDEALNDKLKHFELLSKFLIREHRRRLVIVIDNGDQFSDTIQESLFIFAHSLTRSSLCGTVIALREGYYRKWQNSPPFDAYESNVYHITAPPYASILSKRIDFALSVYNGEEEDEVIKTSPKVFNGIELTNEYIKDYLLSIKGSLLALENSALIDFVNYTTYPNIREGLKVFKIFLVSGHTKVPEYIRRQQERKGHEIVQNVIPLHEFIKSIALQNRHYYNSEISVISNLLNPPSDSTDHFIKLYILTELNLIIEQKNYTERMVPNIAIIEKLGGLGYKSNIINECLSTLMKDALIDTDERLSDIDWKELPSKYNMSLTMKGHYYLKSLLNRFHYYDLVGQDTIIFDTKYFKNLKEVFPVSNNEGIRHFEFRKLYVQEFLSYLAMMESKQPKQIRAVYGSIFENIIIQVNEEIERMKN